MKSFTLQEKKRRQFCVECCARIYAAHQQQEYIYCIVEVLLKSGLKQEWYMDLVVMMCLT